MSPASTAHIAGAGFAAEGALALAHRELGFGGGAYDHSLDAAYTVAMIGCCLAMPLVAAALGRSRLARNAARVASAGYAAMALESAVATVHRVDLLGPLFTLGIAASVLGSLALALSPRVAPRWLAALPLLAMVLAAAGGEQGGSLLSACAWVVLARSMPHARGPVTPDGAALQTA